MKTILLNLILIFCFFSTFAQNWTNITPQKGANPITSIYIDSKNNMNVLCPTGIYQSRDNGVTWNKLGTGIFTALSSAITDFSVCYQQFEQIIEIKDTLHLVFFSKNETRSVFLDKSTNNWKVSGISYKTPNVIINGYHVNKLIPLSNGEVARMSISPDFSTYGFNYSTDGMRTWKSLNKVFKSATILVLNNKWTIYQNDTLFQIDKDLNITSKVIRYSFSNLGLMVRNNKLVRAGFKNMVDNNDSTVLQEIDSLTWAWKTVSAKPVSSEFRYKPFYFTDQGWCIVELKTNYFCKEGILISLDTGKTWKPLNFKKYTNWSGGTIQEFNKKLFLVNRGTIMQNSSMADPSIFDYTSPESFGFQDNCYGDYMISKNYVGSHLSIDICSTDTLLLNQRWDGAKWNKIKNYHLTDPNYFSISGLKTTNRYNMRVVNNFIVVSDDEGTTYKTFPGPAGFNYSNNLNVTEANNVFYAFSTKTYNDTIYVTTNFGQNWTVKKTPLTVFPQLSNSKHWLESKEDSLYLIQNNGTSKKVFYTIDNGDSWTDITYNLPQSYGFFYSFGYGSLINQNTNATMVNLAGSSPYQYAYKLNVRNKSWDLIDSLSYYYSMSFRMDTSLRVKLKNDNYVFELSYDNKYWFLLDEIVVNASKGDTLVEGILFYNAKGLYRNTNYGLLYRPYPSVITSSKNITETDEKENHYSLYPNPAQDFLKLHASELELNYVLTDLTGQVIDKQKAWKTENSISVKNLNCGIYLIRISGTKETTLRFIKK